MVYSWRMALPPFNCAAASDVCCTTLFDTAEFILHQVAFTLQDCLPGADCGCDPLDCYVTMAGDDGNPNALTVEIEAVSPSAGTSAGMSGMQVAFGLFRATFAVRLRESGWPTLYVDDEVIVAPDPAAQHFAARHMYGHGESMYRKLVGMLATTNGFAPNGVTYTRAQLSPLVALPPTSGVAGFMASVTLDLHWGQG